jgi:hypothetical protein
MTTGGRTPSMTPRHVPIKTPANKEAGPEFNMNLTQITSDDAGHVDTSEWMHKWWGHACGCGED